MKYKRKNKATSYKAEEALKRANRWKRLIALGITLFVLLILLVLFEKNLSDIQLLDYLKLMFCICILIFWKANWTEERRKKTGSVIAILSLFAMPAISFFIYGSISGNFLHIMKNPPQTVFLILLLNGCVYYLLYMIAFTACSQIRMTAVLLNTALYLFAVINTFIMQFKNISVLSGNAVSFQAAMSGSDGLFHKFAGNMVIMGLLTLLCNIWIMKLDFNLPEWKMARGGGKNKTPQKQIHSA